MSNSRSTSLFGCALCVAASVVAQAGCGPTSTPNNPDAGTAGFTFQPSNVALSDIVANQHTAMAESVTSNCTVTTDATSPMQDCFMSPIEAVQQVGGTTVNLVVVQSLTVAAGISITATGTVPLVIVSLSDITWSGSLLGNSSLSTGAIGCGGATNSTTNASGAGPGGGPGASDSAAKGGGGGSYCGLGGPGGGTSTQSSHVGGLGIRPLVAGSAGGNGAAGSAGAGGGGVQLVARTSLTVASGGVITVGGGGGNFGGLASDQNAGGGGSGGSVLLEALTASIAGTVAANGGGGGGDYSGHGGGDATANATAAPGGASGSSDGAGGAGSAGSNAAGGSGTVAAHLNAGGGGGGAGRIEIHTMSGTAPVTGTLSPSNGTLCTIQATVRPLSEGP